MREVERIRLIRRRLAERIDNTRPLLNYTNSFELLIAVILSAQTTDRQVNEVTRELFDRYGTAEALAQAEPAEVERIVKSTGFYRQKARNIRRAAALLVDEFGAAVPQSMDDLLRLPGVGRKTANVVRGAVFGEPAVIVDTHLKRVATRLGLTREPSPNRIEEDLRKLIPECLQYELSMLLNRHGRLWCRAAKPACLDCPINDLCPFAGKTDLSLK